MTGAFVVPAALATPPPGWTEETDVLVVGSGVAGLSVAMHARAAGHRVTVVTKERVGTGSTRWAQGGVAAALGPDDTPELHLADTIEAGAGLCDEAAVRVLVEEGPDRVRELLRWGAHFDSDAGGLLALTREGGHRRRRIAHAGGDATGAEVQRALEAAVLADEGVRVVEHALVLDLLRDRSGRACGVTVHVLGEGMPDGVGAVLARAVVLASGGLGQVYAATTNPPVSTGDGVALALRAGAVVADLEFVQFHPTALWLSGQGGQLPLVTEALRGEGAVLVDGGGRRVMPGVHPLADLAPRDVVAKAMSRRMAELGTDHLYLDATALGRDLLRSRFPTVLASCRAAGIDPATDPVPVAPAAHYASGGLVTDLYGRASLPGLYACGEVACTGVHGANRLASNSLLEGLVFARRIGEQLAGDLPVQSEPAQVGAAAPEGSEGSGGSGEAVDPAVRPLLAKAMNQGAGVLRSAEGLSDTGAELRALAGRTVPVRDSASWEASNLLVVAGAIVAAATARTETRGCHWREDWPETDPAWRGSLRIVRDPDGFQRLEFRPVGGRGR